MQAWITDVMELLSFFSIHKTPTQVVQLACSQWSPMWLAEWEFEFLPRLQTSRHPYVWLVCWINVLETTGDHTTLIQKLFLSCYLQLYWITAKKGVQG
jgi:hypothetical protein